MADTLKATDPNASCSVLASAGTGKTWLLVARLTRLLLHGARLDSMLAITFTRKAAGEMQERLNARLRQMLEADDATLDTLLSEIGESPDDAVRARARGLYEAVLRSEQRLRASTFHSFCQDLLQRFPLEAGLPPGFELAEQTGLLVLEAWDALFAEVTATPEQPLADALSDLFDALGGLHTTREALLTFVEHRSDWWAYTLDCADPVAAATDRLTGRLPTDAGIARGERLWNADTRAELVEFMALLEKHSTATNRQHAETLHGLLDGGDRSLDAILQALYPVFFTAGGEPRKRKASKAQDKSMGHAGETRFLALHAGFCERFAEQREHQNRQRTLKVNRAWYTAGTRMLAHYQRIKRERRLLDFADLEWHAYRLLNHPEHAHWVQYKLDQRIDHLLIDEFQDTNPTQWRLVLPLLEEMAASAERARSLFIVGDAKQSIYRFRRGDPRLLGCASAWMEQHLDASRVHLDHSWRSSPLILDTVNKLFQHPVMQDLLEDFQPHATHRTDYWGRLEIWPLIEAPPEPPREANAARLRDPLKQPRALRVDRRHYLEGLAVADRIQALVDTGVATYSDVLILMQARSHLADYEAALRDRHVPYISLDRGTLLQSLEIRDLEALLRVLITPQDNLSLAHVLRSPVFAVDDKDLARLALERTGSWFERLQALADGLEADHPLSRASQLLGQWHALAGRVPIHDLLERIFHQANLPARFRAAFPATEHARVQANLTRFVELALEVDAGRYPTLPRFLERLGQWRSLDKEGPSQATPRSADNQRVRLLTIHAAKGLEAPVVFLVDSARDNSGNHGIPALVRWPAEADRPTDLQLLGNLAQRDSISQSRYEQEQQEARREQANLLYVALTRARNMLVISSCAPGRGSSETSWYQQMVTALCDDTPTDTPWIQTCGTPPERSGTAAAQAAHPPVDNRLREPLALAPVWQEIAPSRRVADEAFAGDEDGRLRGRVIHRLLQLACDRSGALERESSLLAQVANEFGLEHGDPRLTPWWQEVRQLLTAPELTWLMRPDARFRAYNEAPVQYRQASRTVFGIVDRLLVSDTQLHLVDYKTHRLDEGDTSRFVQHYQPQMRLYREALRRLWPQRSVACYLLLTHDARLIEVP